MDAHELGQFSRPNDFIFKITQSEEVCKIKLKENKRQKHQKVKS